MRAFLVFSLLFVSIQSYAQNTALLSGSIRDNAGLSLEGVHVYLEEDNSIITITDSRGDFTLSVPVEKAFTLVVSSAAHEKYRKPLFLYGPKVLRIELANFELGTATITSKQKRTASVFTIDPKLASSVPSVGNRTISLVKSLPGVSSNNELSSQYSVRGGNFDENLIYVNDFEIFKPFLIRSGQQEGLGFVNSDLVEQLSFSAGGFEAKYGDKLSSVLDIQYKRPKENGGSFSVGLLGSTFHLEGITPSKNLYYLFGLRQMSNQYLLDALPTSGEYNPLFLDFQGLIGYDLTPNWKLELLSNYNINRFHFIPNSQQIRFGTVFDALNIRIAYEGQELDKFSNSMLGLSSTYKSDNEDLLLKWFVTNYTIDESESFDRLGSYFIGEVEGNLGEENFGEVVQEFGIGVYHNWARNQLQAKIYNIAHKGIWEKKEHLFEWGLKFQQEFIEDELKEWDRVDSAWYAVPLNDEDITFTRVLQSKADISSSRVTGYIQDNIALGKNDEVNLNFGGRFSYWTLNDEIHVTPRLNVSYTPQLERDSISRKFYFASGLYYQPPFFRELRAKDGNLNYTLSAQKSFHAVLGYDYDFYLWGRPFTFTSEAYYKKLWDLTSFTIDNVLIRYSAENDAEGFAYGADLRLYGEFVEGVDSWFTLSFLNTKEDIYNDQYYNYLDNEGNVVYNASDASISDSVLIVPGLQPRPTDQRVNFSIYFQDYFPSNENMKMNLNLLFGTPLPFSPPAEIGARRTPLRTQQPFFRVDIGFSALLMERNTKKRHEKSLFNKTESIWFALEIFNLIDRENTVSYSWIKDYTNTYYAVPNTLTGRRLNARLVVNF